MRFLTNQDIESPPARRLVVERHRRRGRARARCSRCAARRSRRFGENAIRAGRPMATIEETLVPLYLHHRYQVEAAASVLGGQHYVYALRGDGRKPTRPASAAEQKAALDALLLTLAPAELRLPDAVLAAIPPRPSGYPPHRELFPRYTGAVFDAVVARRGGGRPHRLAAARPRARGAARRAEGARPVAAGARRRARPAGRGRRAGGHRVAPTRPRSRARSSASWRSGSWAWPASARMPQVRALARTRSSARAQTADTRRGGAPRRRARDAAAQDIRRFLARPAATGLAAAVPGDPARPADRRAGSRLPAALEPFCSLAGGL